MSYPPQQPGPYGQQPEWNQPDWNQQQPQYDQWNQQPGGQDQWGQQPPPPGGYGGPPQQSKGGGGRVAVIIIVVVLVLAGGGVGLYLWLNKDKDDTADPGAVDRTNPKSVATAFAKVYSEQWNSVWAGDVTQLQPLTCAEYYTKLDELSQKAAKQRGKTSKSLTRDADDQVDISAGEPKIEGDKGTVELTNNKESASTSSRSQANGSEKTVTVEMVKKDGNWSICPKDATTGSTSGDDTATPNPTSEESATKPIPSTLPTKIPTTS